LHAVGWRSILSFQANDRHQEPLMLCWCHCTNPIVRPCDPNSAGRLRLSMWSLRFEDAAGETQPGATDRPLPHGAKTSTLTASFKQCCLAGQYPNSFSARREWMRLALVGTGLPSPSSWSLRRCSFEPHFSSLQAKTTQAQTTNSSKRDALASLSRRPSEDQPRLPSDGRRHSTSVSCDASNCLT
jgi:hypothetical protein